MPIEEKRDALHRYVRYIGGKTQKVVSWMPNAIFSEANNFTCELSLQDAARLLRQCSDIFRIVGSPNEPLNRPKAAPPPPSPPLPEEGGKRIMRRKTPEKVEQSRLYGKTDGSPFPSHQVAKSQIGRFAVMLKIPKDELEVVDTVDGFFLRVKPKEDPAFSAEGDG